MKNDKIKFTKKYIIISLTLLVLWCAYMFYFYNYYSDAMDMITVGAKKDIQLLELFYYRGTQTVITLVSYFFLVSIHMLAVQYLRIQVFFEEHLSNFLKISIIFLAVMLILSLVNSFWMLFIVLILISFTLNFIIYTISKTRYSYINGDVVFEKKGIKDKETAEVLLNKYENTKAAYFAKKELVLVGNILLESDKTYRIELVVEEKA
ncbi:MULTISPECIES: hypothetical protein [Vagococcus]|uniref:Uncharacterized protein n=1 Tax=Vagococcus fluvialis bH819 TaxID=1255619 RepID=A0A1X6WLY0_9ENTE|nr:MULTISPECIES: hypothetical protein [Vagococcus]SLM85341.1 hypothetical protein FM121_04535 [Vagococcus fluvialis bH819]HCM89365.1 hypothetical protein [Vagococcus sp.]